MPLKKILFCCFAIIIFFCSILVGLYITRNRDECEISGYSKSLKNGKVILSLYDGKGHYNAIDTTLVTDGHFSFKSFKLEQPQFAIMAYYDKRDNYITLMNKTFWVENSRIFISVNISNPTYTRVSGSSTNDLENKYGGFWEIPKISRPSSVVLNKNILESNSRNNDSLIQVENLRLLQKHHQKVQAIIKQNASSFYALYGIKQYYYILSYLEKDSIQKRIQPLLKELTFDISKFQIGKELLEDLARLYNIKLGKIAPNFLCYDSRGAEKHLSSLINKITLIEFWSTGCRPCIEMFPVLTKTYRKYNKKGFEIIGVALNEDSKYYWLTFLKTHPTPWINMIQSKEYKKKASTLYSITYIPQNFLINKQGEIIAVNIFGYDLDEMLNRLLINNHLPNKSKIKQNI